MNKMRYFPIFADTQSLKVLIVGAGDVASRKLELLKRTDAEITIISPQVSSYIENEAVNKRIKLLQREVTEKDICNFDLIYLATANNDLNRKFAHLARKHGIWVNVADNPTECNFITPSIVDRGALVVAISTAGAAPVFARELRAKLESHLPNSLAPLFDFIAERRSEVQQKLPDIKQRRVFWEQFFIANGDRFDSETKRHYINCFNQISIESELTLLAAECDINFLPLGVLPIFQRLDIILFNIEIPKALNELLRRDADRLEFTKYSQLSGMLTESLNNNQRIFVYDSFANIEKIRTQYPKSRLLRPGSF